jgi:hypothetical protein
MVGSWHMAESTGLRAQSTGLARVFAIYAKIIRAFPTNWLAAEKR